MRVTVMESRADQGGWGGWSLESGPGDSRNRSVLPALGESFSFWVSWGRRARERWMRWALIGPRSDGFATLHAFQSPSSGSARFESTLHRSWQLAAVGGG